MADIGDLKSLAGRRAGSNPAIHTLSRRAKSRQNTLDTLSTTDVQLPAAERKAK